jgi:methionyl-tRNA synthetase
MNKFYITTPIYYANAEPHLGHVYTTVCADAVARFHRLSGDETFFLTGTDEHGLKMLQTAAKQGLQPKELADTVSAVFQSVWRELGISHDHFIRTTDPGHKSCVQKILTRLEQNGDIYLGRYEGWYDEGQEEFITETEARARNYLAFNRKPLIRFSEPSYFFRLSKYAEPLQKFFQENPAFIQPAERLRDILSKLQDGLEDLSISRASLSWGIPFPSDPKHVVYVWIDALSNYISAVDYGSAGGRWGYWPADVHLIGKEILWFHAVYWPALLLSLGLPLPRKIVAHGWWLSDGRKMSKTEGNFIGLDKLRTTIGKYGVDGLRYYLLRAAPFGNDLNWLDSELKRSFLELSNVLGNALNRILRMIHSYRGGVLPRAGELTAVDDALRRKAEALLPKVKQAYADLELQECILAPLDLARAVNVYIDETAPYKLASKLGGSDRLDTILNLSAQAIYQSLAALVPALPEKAAAGLQQLGMNASELSWERLSSGLPAGLRVADGKPLFQVTKRLY